MNRGLHRLTLLQSILGAFLLLFTPPLTIPKSDEQSLSPLPERQIDLRALGVEPPKASELSKGQIRADPSLLFDDDHLRVLFIDETKLAVYGSDPVDEHAAGSRIQSASSEEGRRMEAFFVNTDNGNIVSHQVWQTRRRRFFNERYDTQARIMPVRDGFLVHANSSLLLYSPDLQKKREMQLDPSSEYAVMVASGGDVFFIERSMPGVVKNSNGISMVVNGDSQHVPVARGEWLSSETFEKIHSIDLFPGVAASVGSVAYAGPWYKCLDLQPADSTRSHLCCGDPCGNGLPMFLNDREVVSHFRSGFQVLSTSGEVLWGREASNWRDFDFYDSVRSLDGSRFAMSIVAYRRTRFDDTQIPERSFAAVVYDRVQRVKILSIVCRSDNSPEIALSPGGGRLAILNGPTLFLYKLSN